LLAWRESDGAVRHALIGETFIVGRKVETPGLSFPDDALLSRTHFSINLTPNGYLLRDLNSKNGTTINQVADRVAERLLRDGDLILAGNHVFTFLDERQRK
jgi:pSer/pThr/pTyr-binding forkhead associated (FHA) protein